MTRAVPTIALALLLLAPLAAAQSPIMHGYARIEAERLHVLVHVEVGDSGSATPPPATAASNNTSRAPSAPRDLTATAGNARIDLAWAAPLDLGEPPARDYRVYAKEGDGNASLLARSSINRTTFADAPLRAGVTRTYWITAASFQEGPSSNEATATALGAPAAPWNLTATRGEDSVTLAWRAPSDGGSPLLTYRVYAAPARNTSAANDSKLLAEVGAGTTTFTHAGLARGALHTYTVTAVNAVGESAPSEAVTSGPLTVPGAPRNVAAQLNVPSFAVRVSWSPPLDDGGAPLLAYRVWRGTGGNLTLLAQVGPQTTTLWDPSCGLGQLCTYAVSAVNRLGEGARSARATTPG